MKNKVVVTLLILVVLLLAACGSRAGEIARLTDEIARMETEHSHLVDMINEQARTIIYLQTLIYGVEEQQSIKDAAQDEIMDSFMENLGSVAEFLGIHDLYITREDVVLQGNFAAAQSTFLGNGVKLFFRYRTWQGAIEWILLEYIVGPIHGPGFLISRPWWASRQDDMFDESFTMRFYRHWDYMDGPLYDYFDEEILPADWQGQVIYHMQSHLGIQIADLWYEGSHLVVDLTPAGTVPFNWGSLGGSMLSNSLFHSLATLPNVTGVEVLVGGQRRFSADHFAF